MSYKKTGCEVCGVILYADNLDLHKYRVHGMNTVPDDIKAREAIRKVRAFATWLKMTSVEAREWDIPREIADEFLDALGSPFGGHTPPRPTIITRLASRWYLWRWDK